MDIGTKNVFFDDEYLINYSTGHITTKPIRKIDLRSSIQLFNFNNILTQVTIKTNGIIQYLEWLFWFFWNFKSFKSYNNKKVAHK